MEGHAVWRGFAAWFFRGCPSQHSHDHANLWIAGSGSFPTCATPNPTLTIAALAFKTGASLLAMLH